MSTQMDKYRLSELERKMANTILVGKVAEVDPEKGCRVEIGELLTTWLPVLSGRQGDLKQRSPLKVGEVVLVLSHNGDPAQGFVIGSLGPDSIGDFRMVFADGTTVEYNEPLKQLVASSMGTIKASAVVSAEVQAPLINLTGNVVITGTLNVAGATTLLTTTINGTPLVPGGVSF